VTGSNPHNHAAPGITSGKYVLVLLYDAMATSAVFLLASLIYITPAILNAPQDIARTENLSVSAYSGALFKMYLLIIWFGFYSWFLTRSGQTLGMAAWKVKLVSDNGARLSLWQCLFRFFASIMPWIGALFCYHLWSKIGFYPEYKYGFLLLGFGSVIWMKFDPQGLSPHDRFSETRIISLHQS